MVVVKSEPEVFSVEVVGVPEETAAPPAKLSSGGSGEGEALQGRETEAMGEVRGGD